MKQPRIHIRWYAFGDCLAALLSWVLFYFVRKQIIGEAFIVGPKFYAGLILFPLIWVIVYYLVGSYKVLYHKSRLIEFLNTGIYTFFASIIILFYFYCMMQPGIIIFITKNLSRFGEYRHWSLSCSG
ncbi:MAG: hypothetical protein IPH68_11725 [Chitinophagaceae bacterium]|nr:hypothetical protein [Chitinophagaceae bacterium]